MARSITGVVVSAKTAKTIVISTHERKTHPIYKKQYSVTKKFMAHDPNSEAQEGDKVIITECRPLSARKRFILSKILEKALIRTDQSVEAVSDAEIKEEVVTDVEATV